MTEKSSASAGRGSGTRLAGPDFRPLYVQVKDLMIERIGSGAWKPGSLLPNEFRLAEEFGVSQGTVRKALSEMEAQKLVVRHQGRGTFVAEHSRQASLFHFFRIVGADGTKEWPTSVILEQKTRRATREQAAALGLPARAPVHRILRLRNLKGRPVILERITLPAALFDGLTLPIGKVMHDELYVLYQMQFGITVAKAEEALCAVAADETDAAHLGVAVGAPVLEIHRVARDVHGRPVELRIDRCNTAHHRYFTEIV